MQRKDNSGMAVAIILIAAGLIWLLRQAAGLPFFHHFNFHIDFLPFRNFTSGIGQILFSWQMVFIVTGAILIAGRRSSGIVLVVIGAVFLISKMMHFSYWSLPFLVPAVLITVGIILGIRAALNVK